MKKTISISIQCIDNRDLKRIEEARKAIRTIKELAQDMRRTASGTKVECLEAVAKADPEQTPDKTPAFSFFNMTVDVDNLEEIMEKISRTTDELEAELQELTGALYMAISNENPRRKA